MDLSYSSISANFPLSREEAGSQKKLLAESDPLSQQAMKFLKRRGFNRETVETFRLGVTKENGGRITIPIWTRAANGEVGKPPVVRRSIFNKWQCKHCGEWVKAAEVYAVKISGGDVTECLRCSFQTLPRFFAEQHPKYLLSEDHDASAFLYNGPLAEHAMRGEHDYLPLLVVEGYEQVWACHQAGFPNVISVDERRGYGGAGALAAKNIARSGAEGFRKIRPVWSLLPREKGISRHWEGVRSVHNLCSHEPLNECQCRDISDIFETHGEGFLRSVLNKKIEEIGDAEAALSRLKPLAF